MSPISSYFVMSIVAIDIHKLQKDCLLRNIKDNRLFKVCHIDAASIRLISLDGHAISIIPVNQLYHADWKIENDLRSSPS